MIRSFLRNVILWALTPDVKIYVLPGGKLPERKTDGAIGYDAFLRAVVSSKEMDSDIPYLRKCLFDFKNIPDDPVIASHVTTDERGELVYLLKPWESVLVGVGFASEMPFPLFRWEAPRSGLSSNHRISLTNAPGTIDPDYRGEAGILVENRGDKVFALEHNMRIDQEIYNWAIIPHIIEVKTHKDLGTTKRSAGGFGSTGLK